MSLGEGGGCRWVREGVLLREGGACRWVREGRVAG